MHRNPYTPKQPLEDLKRFLLSGTVLPRLIWVYLFGSLLCLVAVLLNHFEISGFKEFIETHLALSANAEIFLHNPWTLFTYPFLSFDFFSFLFGVLLLGYFGLLFCRYLGHRRFFTAFSLASLLSGIFYIVLNTFFASTFLSYPEILTGPLPAVFAIFFGVAYYLPVEPIRFPFFGNVKLKYVAWILAGMELFMVFGEHSAEHLTNLFGGLVGVAFIFFDRKSGGKSFFKPRKKLKVRGKAAHSRPLTDEQYNAERAKRQKEIDRILDKISQHGYSALSKEEKQTLFENSGK